MRSRTAEPAGNSREKDQDWGPVSNPAVRELLDHLADELAREYIRLIKQAAGDNANSDTGEGGPGE